MFITVLAMKGIVPFGDKTFLMFDLKRQYVDYYAYYKTIIGGENNIFYSFSSTLGAGIIGFIAYYMTSPFLIFTLFFDQTSLPLAITLIIGAKLILAALFMELYLERHVTEGGSIGTVICSVSWAFSGFLFAHSMNMMWMDVVILVPVLIHFLENHIGGGRRYPYILILSLMLILNYYMSYQVLIFIALWTLMKVVVTRPVNPWQKIFQVVGSTIISILISAILLVPTAIGLLGSPKDITASGFVANGSNLNLIDLFSKLPTLAYDEQEAFFGFPQLFVGVLLVFLILMFFMSGVIPMREKKGMFVLLAIFAVSFCIDFVNVLWHAGMEPSGHPYRQAYLCVFVMIVMACRAIDNMREDLSFARIAISVVIMLVALHFIKFGMYDHISDRTMKVNYILVGAYTLALVLCLLVKKEQNRLYEALMVILLVANMADLTVNAVFTYNKQSMMGTGAGEYALLVGKNLAAVREIKERDDSFYRMETLNPREQNDSLQYSYNGITHYSSAGLIYARYFLQRLGFNDNELYACYGHDNTATADSLLGVKYIMSDGMYPVHGIYENISGGDVKVYQNPYALSVAVATDGFDLSGISDPGKNKPDVRMLHVPAVDAFALQEDVYSRLLGREVDIFDECDVRTDGLYEKEGKYVYDYEVTAGSDGEMYAYFDGLIRAGENLSVFARGEFLTTYGNASCVNILNLGYMKAGETITVSLQGENEDDDFGRAVFVTENTDALKAAYEEVSSRNCEVTKLSSSHITIDAADHDGVFATIPYQSGWTVRVDGKKTTPIVIYDSLIYIPISESASSHHIDMSYIPAGMREGLILTLIGILLWLRIFISEKNDRQ